MLDQQSFSQISPLGSKPRVSKAFIDRLYCNRLLNEFNLKVQQIIKDDRIRTAISHKKPLN